MKKWLSYIFPFTKRIKSDINGNLEVTWMNGKKILDSKNANYSYGALQKLLVFGLSKIIINPEDHILLLGLGGGSIITPLKSKFHHTGIITAVELDETVIQIAQEEFNITSTKQLQILCKDAFEFIKITSTSYDIIIVDIFIDNKVPKTFYSEAFWLKINKQLNQNGRVIFNAGIHLKDDTIIQELFINQKSDIEFTIHNNVQGTNTLIIGQKN